MCRGRLFMVRVRELPLLENLSTLGHQKVLYQYFICRHIALLQWLKAEVRVSVQALMFQLNVHGRLPLEWEFAIKLKIPRIPQRHNPSSIRY